MLSGLVLALSICACTNDMVSPPTISPLDQLLTSKIESASPSGALSHFILAEANDYANIPNQDAQNPVTYEKIKLGQMLFFDPGIAQDARDTSCYQTYSCATCHVPESGFLPGRMQGIADGAHGFGYQGSVREKLPYYQEDDVDAQGARPLSVLNVAYMTNTLWSGTFGSGGINKQTREYWEHGPAEINQLGLEGLESQNIEGLELHRMSINDHVLDDFGYRDLFDAAFPTVEASERYSTKMASFALSAYLRSLLTTEAPFQDYLKGDKEALTEEQKRGAILFFDKARCYKCHNGPSFSSMNFHALGTADLHEIGGLKTTADDKRNLGRAFFTGQVEDMHRFKVPQLYNVKDYATFFHGSSKETLEDLLEFKINATSENDQVPQESLSALFQPLDLNEEEKAQLIDFLRNGLYDPNIDRFVPGEVPSGLCFPNNDAASRKDLNCK